MMPLRWPTQGLYRLTTVTVVLCLVCCGPSRDGETRISSGVVVEAASEGLGAEIAGIRAGDVLVAWRRQAREPRYAEGSGGDIKTPFDVSYLWFEEEPRGPLTLMGIRDGQALSFVLPPGQWGLVTRPRFEAELEGAYVESQRSGDREELLLRLEEMATAVEKSESAAPWLKAWTRYRHALALWEAGHRSEADREIESARALALTGEDPFAAHWLLYQQAFHAYQADELDRAQALWEEARTEIEGSGLPLFEASAIESLAQVETRRGHFEAAEALHRQALDRRAEWAPDSLRLAQSWSQLAKILARRGRVEEAEELFRRALAKRESLAPGGVETAYSHNDLGVLFVTVGDRAAAQDELEAALELWQRLEPGSRRHATTLNNLGAIAFQRGDLAASQRFHLSSLALQEKNGIAPLDRARSYANLGSLALERGQIDRAEDYVRQGLEIRQRLAPNSLDLSWSLSGLAAIEARRHDLEAAEALLEEALRIRLDVDPESLLVATTRGQLGELALERGEVELALERLGAALEGARHRDRGGFEVGRILVALGRAWLAAGQLETAKQALEEGLDKLERMAPESVWHAGALHGLAKAAQATGDLARARGFFEAAIDALEAQQGRLGGPHDARALFRARFEELYRDYLELLVELGDEPAAFELLERSRARALALQLAERDLRLSADLPAELDRERRRAAARYDRVQQQLWAASADPKAGQIEALRQEKEALRRRQEQIESEVRAQSPRLFAWQRPLPLAFDAARGVLGSDTLLLAYWVAPEHTWLFVVGPREHYRVEKLEVGRRELYEQVDLLRLLIAAGHHPKARPEKLAEVATELGDLLLGPARRELVRAKALLVMPDGPLSLLPFAALSPPLGDSRDGASAAGPRYLIEELPIAYTRSLTVLDRLRRLPRQVERSAELLAFGDPELSPEPVGGLSVARSRGAVGVALAELPAARAEVESIVGLFGDGASAFLGAASSERRAKEAESRWLHFATHTVLDAEVPLDSGLVLAADDEDNGLLQAWEIIEQMHVDADLVVLSACETAVGPEVEGEGLMGLARAFYFAGARSVLASQWRVEDRSTALLMVRFYELLLDGKEKNEALRQTQLEMLRGKLAPAETRGMWWQRGPWSTTSTRAGSSDYTHPYYWAAFELLGVSD